MHNLSTNDNISADFISFYLRVTIEFYHLPPPSPSSPPHLPLIATCTSVPNVRPLIATCTSVPNVHNNIPQVTTSSPLPMFTQTHVSTFAYPGIDAHVTKPGQLG